MNREHAKELLPVFTAFAEGQDVQVRAKGSDHWRDMNCPVWSHQCNYRIKPHKPREWWVDWSDSQHFQVSVTEQPEWIHVREVLE